MSELDGLYVVWWDRQGAEQGLPWMVKFPEGNIQVRAASVGFVDFAETRFSATPEGYSADGVNARGVIVSRERPIISGPSIDPDD